MWDRGKAVSELESPEPDVLFVCGSSRNATLPALDVDAAQPLNPVVDELLRLAT